MEGLETKMVALVGLDERVDAAQKATEDLREVMLGTINSVTATIREEMAQLKETLMGQIQAMREYVESVKTDVALCKAAVASGAMTVREGPRLKVPEPPKFEGKRDSKTLDNFLWSVERYFEAMHVEDDASKISTATMYLSEDAVLWWRRRQEDVKKGLCKITTWDEFKGDIKRQFYPENAEELAMRKLRALRHTGSIRDYISQYSSLMLEIPDMEEKSRLIFFMDGLQRWAEQELKRRGVKTLAEAIAAAESLIEFQRDSKRDKGKRVEDDQTDEEESHQPRAKVDRGKDKAQSSLGSREKGKSFECFLCGGPHLVRTCPQRQKLSAIVASWGEEPATETRMGAMHLEEEVKLANIRVLSTTSVEEPKGEASKTQGSSIKHQGSLMIVNGEVNDVETRVLVDTGATHNFLALGEAKDLGVKFTKVHGELKAMNSRATPVYGRAWNVPIRLGKWRGKVDFLVVDMDDESVVLGMEFLSKVMPFKMGDGVMTITSKGNEYDIKLAASKEVGAKISSLRATWTPMGRRQGTVRGRITTPMPRARHHEAHGRAKEARHGAHTKGEIAAKGHRSTRGNKGKNEARERCTRHLRAGLDEVVKNLGGGECHGSSPRPPSTIA